MATNDPDEWPDIEGALRSWLRNDPGLLPLINRRVFFGIPRDSEGSFPCIMITRIGGGDIRGEAPLDQPMLQFDIYGKKADQAGGGRHSTTIVSLELRRALARIKGKTRLDSKVMAWDARVTTVVYSPMPGDDRPRGMLMAIIPCMVVPESQVID